MLSGWRSPRPGFTRLWRPRLLALLATDQLAAALAVIHRLGGSSFCARIENPVERTRLDRAWLQDGRVRETAQAG